MQKGNKQVRRQVFLGESKFFKKGHIVFLPIYCQEQPSKGALWNSCSALEVKNLEKYVLMTLCSNTSIVNIWNKSRGYHTQKVSRATKLTFTFYSTHPKYQEQLNWYLLFTAPIYHRSVMLMPYMIQSCNIRTIGLTFVSFCHEVFNERGYIIE